jgi:digeranylgeranylglycerophospholipid reductase
MTESLRSDVEHREVLVVGAGPAGSTAAASLAEAGVDTLVIERREIVGNPTQCGECVPFWSEMLPTYPKLQGEEWLEDWFDFPDRVIAKNLDWMRVFSPKMRPYAFDLDCFSAHRVQFDGYLADEAISRGAEIRTSVELRNIQHQSKSARDVYVTDQGRFTADHVIDATGALAHVARLRGKGDRPGGQLPTIYAQVAGAVPDSFDVFLGSVAPGGYAWIIPKGDDVANIGIGMVTSRIEEPLRQTLDKFTEGLELRTLSYGGGWIPLAGPCRSAVSDNVLAVGDAAGLVMPSNGGGIGQAIVSGKYAADAIIANRNDATPLSSYDDILESNMRKPLRISARSKRLFQTLCRGDFTTEMALRFLGTRGIQRAIECHRPLYVL